MTLSIRKMIALFACVILAVTAVILLPEVYASKDTVTEISAPERYMIDSDNHIDYQSTDQCAAYAAAYVLRHFGESADGNELSADIGRVFGFVSPNSVAKLFKEKGYDAKACHGDIDTLKQRVSQGNPVIVFIRVPHDTHYAAVTGYDAENIYLADPMEENANADGTSYNRKVGITDFEALWKTRTLIPDNTYIIIEP